MWIEHTQKDRDRRGDSLSEVEYAAIGIIVYTQMNYLAKKREKIYTEDVSDVWIICD